MKLQYDRNDNSHNAPPVQPVCGTCGENIGDCSCAFGPQED